ncbi:MAG TPA: uridine kinase [Gemmatimonadaceae bacterium]|nr:uridine kinase [Gemmatimonadaceae bacterium]
MRSLVIGIAGGSGSGKSTLARNVATASPVPVVTLDMDGYYRNFTHLSDEERRRVNWDHPDASDLDLLARHIGELAAGHRIDKPVYDFVRHLRECETISVDPAPVIIVDGILLLADARVRDLCDIKVFVDADADIRLARRIRRDIRERGRPIDEILWQYETTVRPMHLEFVEPSKRYADLIVPHATDNVFAVDMIVAKIQDSVHAEGALQ